jgi:hypothetical protein
MSSDSGRPGDDGQHSASDEWAEAIGGDLAERLDTFAFEHEKILDKLDIRAAKAARSLAMELRAVRRTLASRPRDLEDEATCEMVAHFRDLRAQAQDILAGRAPQSERLPPPPKSPSKPNLTPPPSSGAQLRDMDEDDADEITAARTPESLRTTGRKRP